MYEIDKTENKIEKLDSPSFGELGFGGREHLQEWIVNEPSVLGEDLLIIQKEFAGFSDTNERLDLLALDKNASLVIIENKLDDSTKGVVWQSLRYASYCSSLNKDEIIGIFQKYQRDSGSSENAEGEIKKFLNDGRYKAGSDVDESEGPGAAFDKLGSGGERIILVSGDFRKEVTSTVLWLLSYKIPIKCIRVKAYTGGEKLYLATEEIIPGVGMDEYMIGMADQKIENRDKLGGISQREQLNRRFWTQFLAEINKTSGIFSKISAGKSHWLSGSTGYGGITYIFQLLKDRVRAGLIIGSGSKDKNKRVFDELLKSIDQIETAYGNKLDWVRLDEKIQSRIQVERLADCYNEDEWGEINKFMIESFLKLEKAFKEPLRKAAGK